MATPKQQPVEDLPVEVDLSDEELIADSDLDLDDFPDLVLEGSEEKVSPVPILALAAAGLGLLWISKKRKDEEKDEKPKKRKYGRSKSKKIVKSKPEVSNHSNQVIFDEDFSSFKLGPMWIDKTLVPYIEDAIENSELAVKDWKTKGPIGWGMSDQELFRKMEQTRIYILNGFFNSHTVMTSKGNKLISKLPETSAVLNFKNEILDYVKRMQETY